MSAKMSAQFAAGDSAFLVWNWLLDPLGPCSYNTGPGDSSLLGVMASTAAGRDLIQDQLPPQIVSGRNRGQGVKEQIEPGGPYRHEDEPLAALPEPDVEPPVREPEEEQETDHDPDGREQRPVPAGRGRIDDVVGDVPRRRLGVALGCSSSPTTISR